MPKTIKEIPQRVQRSKSKRAKLVLEIIKSKGSVTTDELIDLNYKDPRRAAQDVRDAGIRLISDRVPGRGGRMIASYRLLNADEEHEDKYGRRAISKRFKQLILAAGGNICNLCRSTASLQADHKTPYGIAGDAATDNAQDFQTLCGPCNRSKSWECEHCPNWLERKDPALCQSCYWGSPDDYSHIATRLERRIDLTWTSFEVNEFDRLCNIAQVKGKTVGNYLKDLLMQIAKPDDQSL